MSISFILIAVFVIGYALIVTEHAIKINKSASAITAAVILWVIHSLNVGDQALIQSQLVMSVFDVAGILLFLWGAMTIVEIVDLHGGFSIITDKITTRNKDRLVIAISVATFFLSAILDNLTTSIVMVSLLGKLIPHSKETRWHFVGIVIIAANAGGIWSPIGNVTSTMLWVGGQIGALPMLQYLFVPSVAALIVVVLWYMYKFDGDIVKNEPDEVLGFAVAEESYKLSFRDKLTVLFIGLGGLLLAPAIKMVFHLPPFLGMIGSLGMVWIAISIFHNRKNLPKKMGVKSALKKADATVLWFFVGILLMVDVLKYEGHLITMAEWLQSIAYQNVYIINGLIGIASSVIANVPLVAASQGMYEVVAATPGLIGWESYFIKDGLFWHLLAYCSGAGGSILILGSAAGVAAMNIEGMSFKWYTKNIMPVAFASYLMGMIVFFLLHL